MCAENAESVPPSGRGADSRVVVIGNVDFNAEQLEALNRVGRVTHVGPVTTGDDWLRAVAGASVICTDGRFLLENLPHLHDVFVTFPFVEIGAVDTSLLAERGVVLANARGANRDSVVEWVVFAVLALLRRFVELANTDRNLLPFRSESLVDKHVLILGNGDIGRRAGAVLRALGAEVHHLSRGDSLEAALGHAQVIINGLSTDATTRAFVDKRFLGLVQRGAFFVSYARHYTLALDDLIAAVETGTLAGAAVDCDPEAPFDTQSPIYRQLVECEGVIATPHVAFATHQAARKSLDIMLANVLAFDRGEPTNVVQKRSESSRGLPPSTS